MRRNITEDKKALRKRRLIIFILLSMVLISIFITGSIVKPEEFIDRIGTRNGYLSAFAIAFFAGFSALTAISFYSILIAYIAGGLNPFLLALVVGVSLALGDMFLYWIGRRGRDIISGSLDRRINRLADWFRTSGRERFIPVLSWIYMGFMPLPNDWLLLFLASIRFPHRKMHYIIILGDLTHAGFVTFLATQGILLFD